MATFINNKLLIKGMESVEKQDLDATIAASLDEALSLIQKKGMAINIYGGLDGQRHDEVVNPYFKAFEDGIYKLWVEGRGPKLGPVTRWKPLPRNEFLQWVAVQPDRVKEEIHKNLLEYISEETSREHKIADPNEHRYPMGY